MPHATCRLSPVGDFSACLLLNVNRQLLYEYERVCVCVCVCMCVCVRVCLCEYCMLLLLLVLVLLLLLFFTQLATRSTQFAFLNRYQSIHLFFVVVVCVVCV